MVSTPYFLDYPRPFRPVIANNIDYVRRVLLRNIDLIKF